MTSILTDYSESTKHTFSTLFLGIILILMSLFIPFIHENQFIFIIFKLFIVFILGYTVYMVVSKTLPIIHKEKTNLLASSNVPIKKNMMYNTILLLAIIILIWHVITMPH